jgi:hypothetical protein
MLIAGFESVTAEARSSFANLSVQQFNWKQSSQQWSIAQCLDHLFTANNAYFPIFESVIKGEHRATLWERLPLLPRFFGNVLIQSLEPTSTPKGDGSRWFSR